MLPLIHVGIAACSVLSGGEPGLASVDFKSRFEKFEGCFAIRELGQNWTLRYNEGQCAKRLSPCSTFKIFNALAGLEAKAIAGPDTELKWDGSPQRVKEWEHDHTLASAIKNSVLWYFQEVARRIGAERMRKFLIDCNYGNQDTSGGIDRFWLASSLLISADEQVRFLEDLYQDRLPFNPSVMKTVRGLLVLDQGDGWTFSGKTGTGGSGNKADIGWFVGHLRSGEKQFVFALNIEANDGARGRKAREIAFALLGDLGLLTGPTRQTAGTGDPDSKQNPKDH